MGVSGSAGEGPRGLKRKEPSVADRLAEMASEQKRLKQEIAAKNAEVQAERKARGEMEALRAAAREAKMELERKKRIDRLQAGFAPVVERAGGAAATGEEAAAPEVRRSSQAAAAVADAKEVGRVLGCTNDLQVLKVSAYSSAAEIRKAYLLLSRALHPDKCRVDKATDAFQRVSRAYKDLMKTRG